MSSKTLLTAALMLVMGSQVAIAQTPSRMNQFNAWGTYSYSGDNGKVCYILSTPTRMEPSNVDHGDIFFLISQKPGEGVSYEPQAVMGYELRDGSDVTVTVDGDAYTFFTKGESAWMENAAQEPELVEKMRAGSSVTVKAVSARGTNTEYTYSLSGVTAAMNSIKTCD